MKVSDWAQVDTEWAEALWREYQQCHDLAERTGQTAGIDPAGGGIWFGASIQEVISQRDASGSEAPLYFVRVGSTTYYRKGGHRCLRACGGAERGVNSLHSPAALITASSSAVRQTAGAAAAHVPRTRIHQRIRSGSP